MMNYTEAKKSPCLKYKLQVAAHHHSLRVLDEQSMIDHRYLSLPGSSFSSSLGGLDFSLVTMSSGFRLKDAIEGAHSDVDSAAGSSTDPKKKDKPKRPLSAYNFFFQNERQVILQDIPTRTEGKPRRSHGKIGFADLARSIAAKWRNLSNEDRTIFDERAIVDKERYRKEMEEWRKGQPPSAKKTLSSAGFARVEQPPESLTSLYEESHYMRQSSVAHMYQPDDDERKMPSTNEMANDTFSVADLFDCQFAQAAPTQMGNQEPKSNSPRIADLASQLGEESTDYFLNLFRGDDRGSM